MGALQALAVSHMGSPDLHRAWGTVDVIPRLCNLLKSGALPMRCLAAGALSNFALGSSDASVGAPALLMLHQILYGFPRGMACQPDQML